MYVQAIECKAFSTVYWTDEKVFTVEMAFNHQNDMVLDIRVEDIPIKARTSSRRQNPTSVMIWAGMTPDGQKTPLFFINEGIKVNQWVYWDMLASKVLPWMNSEVWPHQCLLAGRCTGPYSQYGSGLVSG